jgi:hypothetical protein
MVPAVFLVGLAAVMSQALPVWSADGEIIIRATALEPHLLRVWRGSA